MLISCPECKSMYEIDENLIPEKGKKLRCAKCGKIWLTLKEDAVKAPEKIQEDETPRETVLVSEKIFSDENIDEISEGTISVTTAVDEEELNAVPLSVEAVEAEKESFNEDEKGGEDVEMKDMFNRLASQTQEIFKHDETHKVKKIATETLGLRSKTNRLLLLFAVLVIIGLSLFYARFEIVRTIPAMEKVYNMLGIKATISGYGLEFHNVTWKEFEEDYVRKLEIRGFIVNNTSYKVNISNIRIEMLDSNTNVLQVVDSQPPMNFVPDNERISFKVVITKPSPLTKYVLLTFTD